MMMMMLLVLLMLLLLLLNYLSFFCVVLTHLGKHSNELDIFGPYSNYFIHVHYRYTWYKQTFFTRHGIRQKQTTFLLGDLPTMAKKVHRT